MLREKLDGLQAKLRKVELTEIEAAVYIRPLRFSEIREATKKYGNDHAELSVYGLCLSVCDEQGNRLYSDNDLETVRNLPISVINKLNVELSLANGLLPEAVADAKKN